MSTELSVFHKLSKEHLTCEGPQRQKVKLAAHLISHTTATALRKYSDNLDIDCKITEDTAKFLELLNDWFDLANVCHLKDNKTSFTAPYRLHLEEQEALLCKVYETILNLTCIGKNNIQLFQKALLMHINETLWLLNILKFKRTWIKILVNIQNKSKCT